MDPKMTIKNMTINMEKYFADDSVVMQFIPIILILVYVSYKRWFIEASSSVLGKIVAILMILYYTSIDYVYGTLCCISVIAFYQMNEREGFSLAPAPAQVVVAPVVAPVAQIVPAPVVPAPVKTTDIKPDTVDSFNVARDTFIKEKCKNGVLMYKDFPVKPEMADHIFSEIQFNTKTRCNPCDSTCNYSIIEAKLSTETELCPRDSNNIFDLVKNIFHPKRCDWKEPAPAQSNIPHK